MTISMRQLNMFSTELSTKTNKLYAHIATLEDL